ncbi:hypothetical protein QQS21_004567 [Conoideocrella luteorostrata]|uniref:Epoxide hydrolase N-terminal domain-containing protein n=1 Tax=Conoideocrella luteorostrata TaxID=1105319 RepID=A0AAJ0CTK0_9HYPO|nr:hypothetical protein QQS21_004567 [Conoideocrella luteorostrata]
MADYAKLPSAATIATERFRSNISEDKLQQFKKLLELSPIGPVVYENTNAGQKYGVRRDWLENVKKAWLRDFDWRKFEDRMNSFPSFKAPVQDSMGNSIDIQFFALFSEREDAIPIVFVHGWPGSSCDFLDMLEIVKRKYSAKEMPYHVVVPSLPGYAFSSGPPAEVDYGIDMAAGAINSLMVGLGFGNGYLTQGGDLGSFVSRMLAIQYDACKGMHVNQMGWPPNSDDMRPVDADEEEVLQKASEIIDTGFGFVLEQGTRPATIGLALSASPLALLSWIGEQYLQWVDGDFPVEKILEVVTLYWLTDTFPRSLYHNRGLNTGRDTPKIARISVVANMSALKLPYVEKPSGYSCFAHNILPVSKRWAAMSCNLVSFKKHDHGGHFAPLEKPSELLADVEEFIWKVWAAPGRDDRDRA